MGCSPSAELIWGIPVERFDSDYEPTGWWDEENDDWRTFPDTDLYIEQYGHYEDPDGPRGILTSKRIKPIRGDAWDPQNIEPGELATSVRNDKLYSKSNDQARSLDLGVNFYSEASWWLVASYG